MTEQTIRESLEQFGIPAYMHGGIIRYLLHGIPPGHFMMSVITNDLRGAFQHADDTNVELIGYYVKWFYNCAPSECWGSEKKAQEWIKHHGLEQKKEG